ncbi:hypothetical protein [Halonotius sp. GCM10025705]|uniref:hypothetical protein n=1 Tax=Halonotius sp. GCM10025705 TaxID=3252678 RepID=UPI00361C76BD
MATERTQSGKEFLAELARGGFAESLTPHQRRQIHISTDLDEFLINSLEKGKQVVLTGNPGDGKTQHILMRQDQYPPEDYYYLLDASEYADYTELLDEWSEAYTDDKPGVLAINDGPLYEMATSHSDEYDFLQTVKRQLENQIVYSDSDTPNIDFSDLVVVDLNNRDVLSPGIVTRAVRNFVNKFALEGHDHSGQCHIQYNAEKMQNDRIQENLIDFLTELGNYEVHTTVRDLLNFLCYILTAGLKECQTKFGEELKYYNLAFEGSGESSTLLDRNLTHLSWCIPSLIVGSGQYQNRRLISPIEMTRQKLLNHYTTGRNVSSSLRMNSSELITRAGNSSRTSSMISSTTGTECRRRGLRNSW